MEAHAIAQADYLDILFDNRNKAYGGYLLRKQHGERMYKALLMVVALCASIIAYSMLPDNKPIMQTPTIVERVVDLVNKDDILPPKPPKPEEVKHEPPAKKSTEKLVNPEIKPDNLVLTPPVDIDSFIGKDPGPTTTDGDPDGQSVATNNNVSGSGTEPVEPVAPPAPVRYTEVMPSYNGSINQYLAKHIRYPQMARNANISGRVLVSFVVNEDGSVQDARVERGIGGGCDEEALRVVKNMPNWKPGIQNGRAVRVLFTLPIVFRLE
ncbi:MAG: energy transducer TonB [Chitinophagaceae bacterium]|nr:energy transducer TonB [Chitinophagaceae bacterium]